MANALAQSRQGAENRNARVLTCFARLGASAPLREILCLSGHAFISGYRPCFKALSDERALPAAVRGPVHFWAFRRLAARKAGVKVGDRRRHTGASFSSYGENTWPSDDQLYFKDSIFVGVCQAENNVALPLCSAGVLTREKRAVPTREKHASPTREQA